jgi:branched-chain amino acid aminotransferase
MAPDTHPAMVKAVGNYVNSQMVILEAKRHGYAEGLVLDTQGFVCEGSGENVFLFYDGALYTPPVGESILPGVTRSYVLQLARDMDIPVREERVAREMLYMADEIFMTGTAAEITPVRSVDRRRVGSGTRGPVATRLQQAFFGIIRGEQPDEHGWLTHINPT